MIDDAREAPLIAALYQFGIISSLKKDNLSERMALIIAGNLEDRLKVYNIMGELYEVRSEIVHQGNINVNIKDRNQLQNFTFLCLIMQKGGINTSLQRHFLFK